MRRVLSVAIACLMAGVALAGCAGNSQTDDEGDGTPRASGAPQATVVSAPASPGVGESVVFRASQAASTDAATWSFGDGATGTGIEATHAYDTPGSYIALLKLENAAGKTATNDASLTYVTVTQPQLDLEDITDSTPPQALAASSAQVVKTGSTVDFTANGSGEWIRNPDFDAENPTQGPGSGNEPWILSADGAAFAWDFADDASANGVTASHTFDEAGLYPVKLTVTASDGASASYVLTIRVLPDQPPAANVRNPLVFTTATIGEPESLDPAYDYEQSGGTIIQQVYETLYFYKRDAADTLEPKLAAAMPQYSADGSELTIKLRQGVKFHDGTDMTAEDVKFSFDRLILMNDPHGPAWMYSPIAGADAYMHSDGTATDRAAYLAAGGVTIVDPYTVKIKLEHADPSFLFRLAFNAASIVSQDGVCAKAEPDFVDCIPPPGKTRHAWMDSHEVGSGPFQLEAWIPGQQVILKRFDGYWGQQPALEKVIIQKVEDINTRLLMLFSGQADSVYVPVDHDVDVQGREDVRVIENPSWGTNFAAFTQKFCGGPESANFESCMTAHGADAPKGADGKADPLFFADLNMRKAWTHAFDYDMFYEEVLNEHGKMLNGPLPTGIFGYDATVPAPKQDLEKAREYFAQSNHPDGFTVKVFYNTGNTIREKAAEMLAQNVESIAPGKINVEVQGLDWSTAYLPKFRAKAMPVWYLGWAPDYAFPDNYVHTFGHSEMGAFAGRLGYEDPELNAKLDGLLRETDEQKLLDGYHEAVREINSAHLYIWLNQGATFHVERTWVNGYYYNPMHSGLPLIGDYSAISKG